MKNILRKQNRSPRADESGSYARVQPLEIAAADDEHLYTSDDEINADEFQDNAITTVISHHEERHGLFSLLFILAMVASSVISLVPYYLMISVILELTMRWYFCAITTLLQFAEKMIVFLFLRRMHLTPDQKFSIPVYARKYSNRRSCECWLGIIFIVELVIMAGVSVCYLRFIPYICKEFVIMFFTGIDGTLAREWNHEENEFAEIAFFSKICGGLYLVSVVFGLVVLFYSWQGDMSTNISTSVHSINIDSSYDRKVLCFSASKLFNGLRRVSFCSCVLTAIFLMCSLSSAWTYLKDHPLPSNNNVGPHCDPIDTTECLLPFPSSFFSVEDSSTETGQRVNIHVDALRSIYRGQNQKHNVNVNDQDGFSTSGTILFYVDGLKEGGGVGIEKNSRLIGPDEIHLSTTERSLTLLVDLDKRVLIPHFAEIDYLDEERPLVIVQAAKSLTHNTRYAVALVNAVDMNGNLLAPSTHLSRLLHGTDESLTDEEKRRRYLYRHEIVPIIYEAAFWIDNDSTFQMLFDFHTVSVNGQLGHTRKMVDGSLSVVQNEAWGGWGEHNVRVVKMIDNEKCIEDHLDIGRVIHAEIDLPSFLLESNERAKRVDVEALNRGETASTAPFKVVIIVPCSLARGTTPLSAVVDYGHGFLYSRQELLGAQFLHNIANEEGYILFASNWRGMCFLDLGVIVRAFVAEPYLLDSIKANIMQGYGNKAAIQHFVKSSLLQMEFMTFENPIQVKEGSSVRYVFYGISQGGILGSAYSSLLSNTGLLDGSIITSSGTPFSLLMSRSTVFRAYQILLLMSLNHNRHVRLFISLMQMYFDPIDGPIVGISEEGGYDNNGEFKTLIQAGIGDPVVTTIGTEIMAREYNAAVFPTSPREIFGIPRMNNTTNVCLTEILYTEENDRLPSRNVGTTTDGNSVHFCARSDAALLQQLTEFINTGTFLDICITGGCVREKSQC